jgi:hypothetical protein
MTISCETFCDSLECAVGAWLVYLDPACLEFSGFFKGGGARRPAES